MYIKLSRVGKIIINNQRHLLDIQSPPPYISCYQNPTIGVSKFIHNRVSFLLAHITMHT